MVPRLLLLELCGGEREKATTIKVVRLQTNHPIVELASLQISAAKSLVTRFFEGDERIFHGMLSMVLGCADWEVTPVPNPVRPPQQCDGKST